MKRVEDVLAQDSRAGSFPTFSKSLPVENAGITRESVTSIGEQGGTDRVGTQSDSAERLADRVGDRLKVYQDKLKECEQQREESERALNEVRGLVFVFETCLSEASGV